MCFSPQADLVGGIAVVAIGIDAVRHVHERNDHIALAALPIVLGAHQIDEAFVWWGLQGHLPASAARVALWVYLAIAFVVLPFYVPLAVRAIERVRRRREVMTAFVAVGIGVGVLLLIAIVRGPVGAHLAPYHIGYEAAIPHGLVVVSLYVAAICGALLFSSYRHVFFFGIANLIAVAVLARLTVDGFASIWCAYAALASGAIAAHMRFAKPHRAQPYVLT